MGVPISTNKKFPSTPTERPAVPPTVPTVSSGKGSHRERPYRQKPAAIPVDPIELVTPFHEAIRVLVNLRDRTERVQYVSPQMQRAILGGIRMSINELLKETERLQMQARMAAESETAKR